jgi:hypothetical protein
MRKYLFIRAFALIAFFIAFTAFMLPVKPEQKNTSGEKFSKLSIAVKSTVYVEQGSDYKVDIQADESDLEKIVLDYKSDELTIKCKPGSKISEPVTIYIVTPTLNEISIAGSSDLFMEKTFETNEMGLSIAGSGNMDLKDLKTDKVTASIAGSGNLILAGGKSGSAESFSIAGSGKIDALGFNASAADVEIAGSGDCRVNASEELNVSIAGSGDVYYKGKPKVNSESAGSGKVSSL